jgi:hypothetical protein
MKIHKRLSDFPQPLKIFKIANSISEYIGCVNHEDELEDCIIQALFDKDDEYYVMFDNFNEYNVFTGSTKINLKDEDLFDQLDKVFKGATSYPMISFNLINAIRTNKDIEEAKNLYEKHYGVF